MSNYPKYRYPEPIPIKDRQWPDRIITAPPIWASVDLRDGNQALPEPMSPEHKLEYFNMLLGIGFKEIEVSFPSASADDHDFVRMLIDRNLIPILAETLAERDNIEVVNRDILKTDVNALIAEAREKDPAIEKVRIIGNLPYYITTPIIMKLLEEGVCADGITVMMQKEVADRIKAPAGNKTYGALSVAVQYYCEVEGVVNVPKEVFVPQPKVDSAVLNLKIRKEKPVELMDDQVFFQVVKAGFGQRRKTLNNSLMGVEGITREIAGAALEAAGIEPSRRAETLTLEEFAKLSNEVKLRL